MTLQQVLDNDVIIVAAILGTFLTVAIAGVIVWRRK
jgi:uncharacterized membrane protein